MHCTVLKNGEEKPLVESSAGERFDVWEKENGSSHGLLIYPDVHTCGETYFVQVRLNSGPSWWPDLLFPCAQSEGSPSMGPLRGHCCVLCDTHSEELVSASVWLIHKPLVFHGRTGLERTHLGIYADLWVVFFFTAATQMSRDGLCCGSRGRFPAYHKAAQVHESCPALGPYTASRGVAGRVCQPLFPVQASWIISSTTERAKVRLAVNGSSSLGISGIMIPDTWPVVFCLVSWQGFLK